MAGGDLSAGGGLYRDKKAKAIDSFSLFILSQACYLPDMVGHRRPFVFILLDLDVVGKNRLLILGIEFIKVVSYRLRFRFADIAHTIVGDDLRQAADIAHEHRAIEVIADLGHSALSGMLVWLYHHISRTEIITHHIIRYEVGAQDYLTAQTQLVYQVQIGLRLTLEFAGYDQLDPGVPDALIGHGMKEYIEPLVVAYESEK